MIIKVDIRTIEQMFCKEEGLLSKYTEVNINNILEWLGEKVGRKSWEKFNG